MCTFFPFFFFFKFQVLADYESFCKSIGRKSRPSPPFEGIFASNRRLTGVGVNYKARKVDFARRSQFCKYVCAYRFYCLDGVVCFSTTTTRWANAGKQEQHVTCINTNELPRSKTGEKGWEFIS